MGVDDGSNAERVGTGDNVIGVVTGVADYRLALDVEEELFGDCRFVLLPRGELQVDWLTACRCDGVNFR